MSMKTKLRAWLGGVVEEAVLRATPALRVSKPLTMYSASAIDQWRDSARRLSRAAYGKDIGSAGWRAEVDALAFTAAQAIGVAASLRAQAEAAWAAHSENGGLKAALLLNAERHLEALRRLAEVEPSEDSRQMYAAGADVLAAQIATWKC